LPQQDVEKLHAQFGELRGIGLVFPDFARASFR